MKSPFPGMDPYLEQHWRDMHHRLITYTADLLGSKLPRELWARIEERVFVEWEEGERPREIYPEVFVIEQAQGEPTEVPPEGGVAVAEPLPVQIQREPASQGYIEIVDTEAGNRVVSVIEFLSPTNKIPGDGQDQYLQKQREVLASHASLVEIDLTRSGTRSLAASQTLIPPHRRATYMVCVSRGWKRGWAEIYSTALPQRLPVIRVPLRETDADVVLDLQAILDQCYDKGGYTRIDYRAPPRPPLTPADASWADEWLRRQGVR